LIELLIVIDIFLSELMYLHLSEIRFNYGIWIWLSTAGLCCDQSKKR